MNTITPSKCTLLPAFILLLGALVFSFSALAQDGNTNENTPKISKTIYTEEINGETTVTVTTKTNGNVHIDTYRGKEAEAFLKKEKESMKGNTHAMKVQKFNVTTSSDSADPDEVHRVVYMSNEDVDMQNMNDIDVNITDTNNNTTIELSFTNENGEKVDKVVVIDEDHITKSIEGVTDLLESLNINFDLDVDVEDENESVYGTEQVISTSKKSSNNMFQETQICNNMHNGNLELSLTPLRKENVAIAILDMKGNVLFMDNFKGKSTYKKSIHLSGFHGDAMLKLEQGTDVEMRKIHVK